MNAAMQILGAYVLFALAMLAILFCTVSCAMIAVAGYEAICWARERHWNISSASDRAKAASH